MTDKTSIAELLRDHPMLNNAGTLRGLDALLERIAPLLAAQRFDNVVDLLSALSDIVNMADNAMVEKLSHDYEGLMSTVFNLGGAMRYASDQAARESDLPTLWQTIKRLNKDEDVRRGLLMLVNLLAVLGRDVRNNRDLMRAES